MSHLPNPRRGLRLAALLWVLCTLLPAGTVYLAQEEWGTVALAPLHILFFGGGLAALLFGASFLAPIKLDKVLPTYMLLGLGFSAFLVLTIGVGGTFLLAPTIPVSGKLLGVGLVAASAAVWCRMALRTFRCRIREQRVMDREFEVQQTRIVMRHPFETDLEAPQPSERTPLVKFYETVGPYVVFAIPIAYPLQRLLRDAGGLTSVLLLLFALCIPLTLHMLGRIACGAYLRIYVVWKMERWHGKPVVLGNAR